MGAVAAAMAAVAAVAAAVAAAMAAVAAVELACAMIIKTRDTALVPRAVASSTRWRVREVAAVIVVRAEDATIVREEGATFVTSIAEEETPTVTDETAATVVTIVVIVILVMVIVFEMIVFEMIVIVIVIMDATQTRKKETERVALTIRSKEAEEDHAAHHHDSTPRAVHHEKQGVKEVGRHPTDDTEAGVAIIANFEIREEEEDHHFVVVVEAETQSQGRVTFAGSARIRGIGWRIALCLNQRIKT